VPRISIEETQTKLQQGQALLVDVRSRAAYDKEHALGAISMPESEVGSRLGELSPGKDLVLYCT
jgi:rhodanese-related sulfurtransferase